MAQVTEPRVSASASAQSTIQDVFLNYARRDHLSVTIHLMDGRQLEALPFSAQHCLRNRTTVGIEHGAKQNDASAVEHSIDNARLATPNIDGSWIRRHESRRGDNW